MFVESNIYVYKVENEDYTFEIRWIFIEISTPSRTIIWKVLSWITHHHYHQVILASSVSDDFINWVVIYDTPSIEICLRIWKCFFVFCFRVPICWRFSEKNVDSRRRRHRRRQQQHCRHHHHHHHDFAVICTKWAMRNSNLCVKYSRKKRNNNEKKLKEKIHWCDWVLWKCAHKCWNRWIFKRNPLVENWFRWKWWIHTTFEFYKTRYNCLVAGIFVFIFDFHFYWNFPIRNRFLILSPFTEFPLNYRHPIKSQKKNTRERKSVCDSASSSLTSAHTFSKCIDRLKSICRARVRHAFNLYRHRKFVCNVLVRVVVVVIIVLRHCSIIVCAISLNARKKKRCIEIKVKIAC